MAGQHDFARLGTISDDLPAKRHDVSTIFHDMGAKPDDLPAKSHARHGALARRWPDDELGKGKSVYWRRWFVAEPWHVVSTRCDKFSC